MVLQRNKKKVGLTNNFEPYFLMLLYLLTFTVIVFLVVPIFMVKVYVPAFANFTIGAEYALFLTTVTEAI